MSKLPKNTVQKYKQTAKNPSGIYFVLQVSKKREPLCRIAAWPRSYAAAWPQFTRLHVDSVLVQSLSQLATLVGVYSRVGEALLRVAGILQLL